MIGSQYDNVVYLRMYVEMKMELRNLSRTIQMKLL